ncbi:hypothetical protein YQE_03519, partial [Dendroctonus ponderosae]
MNSASSDAETASTAKLRDSQPLSTMTNTQTAIATSKRNNTKRAAKCRPRTAWTSAIRALRQFIGRPLRDAQSPETPTSCQPYFAWSRSWTTPAWRWWRWPSGVAWMSWTNDIIPPRMAAIQKPIFPTQAALHVHCQCSHPLSLPKRTVQVVQSVEF